MYYLNERGHNVAVSKLFKIKTVHLFFFLYFLAWSFYTVKMETCIFNTLNLGNLLLSPEEISKIWVRKTCLNANTHICLSQ